MKWVGVVLGLSLAACQVGTTQQQGLSSNPAGTPDMPALPPGQVIAEVLPPVEANLAIVIEADETGLYQMTAQQITEALPAPNLERIDGGAIIRQYRNSYCIMDMYFYQDDQGPQLDHVDMRLPWGVADQLDRGACLTAFFDDGSIPALLKRERVLEGTISAQ